MSKTCSGEGCSILEHYHNRVWTRNEIIKDLTELIPNIKFRTSEDWGSKTSGALITSGEDGSITYKGIPAFDYYQENDYLMREAMQEFGSDYKFESSYVSGIQKDLANWLKEKGWNTEWQDAGTVFLYLEN